MFCPKCGIEYEDWAKECTDCKVSLVKLLKSKKQKYYPGYKFIRGDTYIYEDKKLKLASRGSRFIASFLDGLLCAILPVFTSFLEMRHNLSQLSSILIIFGAIVGLMIYVMQIKYLTFHGQSLGKKALNIKIIKVETGENGGFGTNIVLRIIFNAFLYLVPFYSFADILFIFRDDKRCLHDLLAKTCVVEA